jgi:hypothetical protein
MVTQVGCRIVLAVLERNSLMTEYLEDASDHIIAISKFSQIEDGCRFRFVCLSGSSFGSSVGNFVPECKFVRYGKVSKGTGWLRDRPQR